jgi:hypothetical protein
VIDKVKSQPTWSVFSAKANYDWKDILEEFVFE